MRKRIVRRRAKNCSTGEGGNMKVVRVGMRR
jgi:hypothetical protein